MRIAILSGKGGTGKTTIVANLVATHKKYTVIDTDVEEPNLNIFIKADILNVEKVETEYPEIDMEKCNLCGKCGEFCRFNAIIPAINKVLIFEEVCHDCGGCKIVCPNDAIIYRKRELGKIYSGKTGSGIVMNYGELNVGEMSGVKIIEELKQKIKEEKFVIIDSPPGTSCSTVAALIGVEYAVIVSEPTPFGVSDMKMVVEMLRELNIPFGVVVNKAGLGDNEIYIYCEQEKIEILEEIPFDIELSKNYAHGRIFTELSNKYTSKFINILERIEDD